MEELDDIEAREDMKIARKRPKFENLMDLYDKDEHEQTGDDGQ